MRNSEHYKTNEEFALPQQTRMKGDSTLREDLIGTDVPI